MDEATVQAMLEQHFADSSHVMYHDDAVLEFPQSGAVLAGPRPYCAPRYAASRLSEISRAAK